MKLLDTSVAVDHLRGYGPATALHSHSGIGVADYLLAGTVSAVGADLVTTNVKHFPMFDDLRPPYEYGPPEQRRTGRG